MNEASDSVRVVRNIVWGVVILFIAIITALSVGGAQRNTCFELNKHRSGAEAAVLCRGVH